VFKDCWAKVFEGKGGKTFTPADGVDYLMNLPLAFQGSRLWVVEETV
jgi:hypothetical protein